MAKDKERAEIVAATLEAEQGVREAQAALDEARATLRAVERRWSSYQARVAHAAQAAEAKRQAPILAKLRSDRLAKINRPIEDRIKQVKADLALAVRCQSRGQIEDCQRRLAALEASREANAQAVNSLA